MSIHAQISQEAQERLARQKRNSTITSFLMAGMVIALIMVTLGVFLLPNLAKENPTIVTYSASAQEESQQESKKVNTKVQRKPSAPSSTQAPVIASTSPSALSIPVPEVMADDPAVEFGDGDGFGGGWGEADDFSKGGGASFFNQSVTAERIAYVIDYSASMRGEKDELMRNELTKSVGGLAPGTKYQMIFFSGPAWVAGSEVDVEKQKGKGVVTGSGGHKYDWEGKGAGMWGPKGKRQEVEWLDVSGKNLRESKEIIEKSVLAWGTDWTNPLEMAFGMDPAPQIIFFMTDGLMGGRDTMDITRSLASKAKSKGIVVNSIALMEPRAEEAMYELADRTGGVFTIVEEGGKSREVKRVSKK